MGKLPQPKCRLLLYYTHSLTVKISIGSIKSWILIPIKAKKTMDYSLIFFFLRVQTAAYTSGNTFTDAKLRHCWPAYDLFMNISNCLIENRDKGAVMCVPVRKVSCTSPVWMERLQWLVPPGFSGNPVPALCPWQWMGSLRPSLWEVKDLIFTP